MKIESEKEKMKKKDLEAEEESISSFSKVPVFASRNLDAKYQYRLKRLASKENENDVSATQITSRFVT